MYGYDEATELRIYDIEENYLEKHFKQPIYDVIRLISNVQRMFPDNEDLEALEDSLRMAAGSIDFLKAEIFTYIYYRTAKEDIKEIIDSELI